MYNLNPPFVIFIAETAAPFKPQLITAPEPAPLTVIVGAEV